jgi:aspartate/methionine/tyrosine aminotransferase
MVLDRRMPTIQLHVGEPRIGMPAAAVAALCKAAQDGRVAYGDAPGLPELRERLRVKLREQGVTPAEIFITPGSCQAIAATLLSLAREGASVLLPQVHWPTHLQQVIMTGFKPRFFVNDGRRDIVAALEAAYEPSVQVLVVNSPANPSGQVLGDEVLERVHAWATQRGVWLISDEAYEDFIFEGEAVALARFDAALEPEQRRVFTVRTFSKGYSFTGCRLGYVAAPNATAAERLRRVQEASIIAPSTPIQWAGLAALDDIEHRQKHHRYVRETRDAVVAALRDTPLAWFVPSGGWYMLLDVSGSGCTGEQFSSKLLAAAGVAVAPGSAFVAPGAELPELVRIALCAGREETLEGVERLVQFYESAA